jgi:hypothetical protein
MTGQKFEQSDHCLIRPPVTQKKSGLSDLHGEDRLKRHQRINRNITLPEDGKVFKGKTSGRMVKRNNSQACEAF